MSEADSLFTYRGSDTYASVNNDTGFTPQFGLDLDSIPDNVKEACAGNTLCLYDYQQTGSLEVAMTTATEQETLSSMRTVLSKLSVYVVYLQGTTYSSLCMTKGSPAG